MLPSAVVVGGGPAGTSAALGLLHGGFDVTLLEQRTRWTGRVCGAFLNPEAVSHLRRLNVLEDVLKADAVPVESVTVTTPKRSQARIEIRQRGQTGLGLPRQTLEEILLRSVRRAGGRVEMGARVKTFRKEEGIWRVAAQPLPPFHGWLGPKPRGRGQDQAFASFLGEQEKPVQAELLQNFSGSLLVLADGRFSRAQSLSSPRNQGGGRENPLRACQGWYGWNALFQGVPQKPGQMSLHFYPGGYVGVITFSNGDSNVCGLAHKTAGEPKSWDLVCEEAMNRQPSLCRLLRQAHRVNDWRGVGPLPFTTGLRRSPGPLLAGDAAAVGDPFMGEGIGRALGAGPMIQSCLRPAAAADVAPEVLLRKYESLWRQHYTSRLRLGFLARQWLKSSFLFTPLTELIFRQGWTLRSLTPIFHAGFRSSDASPAAV